jgi:hypothetical protein
MYKMKWFARNDLDISDCGVFQRMTGGGITASDLFNTEEQALKYLIGELDRRMVEHQDLVDSLKVRLANLEGEE